MRTHIKNPWVTDPDYIVRLTTQLVGPQAIGKLQNESCEGPALWLAWKTQIGIRIEGWNDQTLGRIAAYGNTLGNHSIDWRRIPKPTFINRTGTVDLFHYNAPEFFSGNYEPRAMLEMLAVATIICVLRDIILQDTWLYEWDVAHEEGAKSFHLQTHL